MDTKPCIKCLEVLPLSSFHKNKKMKDGHLNCCRSCAKAYASHITNTHRREYMKRYKASDKHRKYLQSDDNRKSKKRWQDLNKHKVTAHNALNRAVRAKTIKITPCEICGSSVNIQAHHEDYSKPLIVNWLCQKHHDDVHYAGLKIV